MAETVSGDLARKLVEMTRRAEIIALVNDANDVPAIVAAVAHELSEALEAELVFVLALRGDEPAGTLLGAVGLLGDDAARLLRDPACGAALHAGDGRELLCGPDALGLGAARAAVAAVTTRAGDRVLVGVGRLDELDFDAVEAGLLEAVARCTGQALERAWMAEEVARRATHEAALARTTRLLHASLDVETVLATLAREATAAIGADMAAVSVADGGGARVIAAHGLPADFVGFHMLRGDGLSGRALAHGRVEISNAYRDDGFGSTATAALRDIRSAIAVPVHAGDVRGVLAIGFRRPRWIGAADAEVADAFAQVAGAAWRNADAHAAARRAAAHDSLTGCLNHGAFQAGLREEISRAERSGLAFSVVLLDLVGFKAVNDSLGHLAGDDLLRGVADALRGAVRGHDRVARSGGDEFALLLPDADESAAAAAAERARAAVATLVGTAGEQVHAHVGVGAWRPGEQATELLERADAQLRAAKRKHAAAADPVPALPRAPAKPVEEAFARLRRLADVAVVGTRLSRLLDTDALPHTAVTELRETLGYQHCEVLALDGEGHLEVVAADDHALVGERRAQDDGAAGRSLREDRTVMLDGERPRLATPIHAGTRPWGAVELRGDTRGALGDGDARLLEAIAEYLGAGLRSGELLEDLERSRLGIAEALAAALEAKDDYTADHARSIADLAVDVGRRLGLTDESLDELRLGAVFHDIGKIAVPDAILNKPGPLDRAETVIVRRHPVVGEQILAPVPGMDGVRRIVRHDHERWDGTGYPDGLSGPRIPLGARIVLAVDAYHAMVSDRPYRAGMGDAAARAELLAHAGTQFDPDVVTALLAALDAGASV